MAEAATASFFDFLLLGARHIFTGYDHLFFLVGLLIACTRWRSLVIIITGFTLGHSLTLALTTLGAVHIPARVAEPLIALSILWVGVENLLHKNEPPAKGRAVVALLFGLVHGCGFASVLLDLGVGAHGRSPLVPLLAFNLGVELGQIAFGGLVWPLILLVKRRPDTARGLLSQASALVALAGAYWLLERVFLS